MLLSNLPIKGTADWFGFEFKKRQYIFDTWTAINKQFGYEQYLTPLLELADIYRAKSGEDVAGPELMTMTDRGGRDLAIRPEMTPSVTRMVTRLYNDHPKPLRLFSIANFFRNEKPQRGRNREFWQLNTDIFGEESAFADQEILQLSLEIMKAFNAPSHALTLRLNHRELINQTIKKLNNTDPNTTIQIIRLLDKYNKLPTEIFNQKLETLGISHEQIQKTHDFLALQSIDQLSQLLPELASHPATQLLSNVTQNLKSSGYTYEIKYDPTLIRGFDYYDGLVFEVFDNHPDNRRSMFGGGRYNGLAGLYGNYNIPAVGVAPGDETTAIFLESWQLIPEHLKFSNTIFLPILEKSLDQETIHIAQVARQSNLTIKTSSHVMSLSQALKFAGKQQYPWIIIYGSEEAKNHTITSKNLLNGEQSTQSLEDTIKIIKTANPPLAK